MEAAWSQYFRRQPLLWDYVRVACYLGSMCPLQILSTLPTPQSIRYFSTTEIVGFGSVSLMNASFLLEMTTAVVPLPTLPVPFPEME
jgi:hypothetical protein